MLKRGTLFAQKFKCNFCGFEQIKRNHDPLDLVECNRCGKLTAEVN